MKRHIRILSVIVVLALLGVSLGAARQTFAQVSPTAVVNTGALNVRSGPGVGFGVLASYFRGTVLTLVARNAAATWVKVITPTGVQGWVSAPFIATSFPIASLPVEGGTTTLPTTGYRTHVVQPGENLFRIALNYGVNMYDIARLNGIINLALIYAGQTLLIP